LWASHNKETVTGWISERSGIEQSVVKKVMGFNENWALPEDGKRAFNLSLTQEDIEILEECNDYIMQKGQIPADFDIKNRIRLNVFNK